MALTALTEDTRGVRLTALVGTREAETIAKRAAARGLSVSAYLRQSALRDTDSADDEAALRQIDALIDRMERDIDSAIADLTAALARMAAS